MFFGRLTKGSTEVRRLKPFRPLGTMITKEADPMSATRFRMMKADRAFGMDRKNCQEKRNC